MGTGIGHELGVHFTRRLLEKIAGGKKYEIN